MFYPSIAYFSKEKKTFLLMVIFRKLLDVAMVMFVSVGDIGLCVIIYYLCLVVLSPSEVHIGDNTTWVAYNMVRKRASVFRENPGNVLDCCSPST